MKNNAESTITITEIENDFILYKLTNKTSQINNKVKEVSKDFIQLHFALGGGSKLNFNNGRYSMPVPQNSSLLLYNPQQDLPINLDLAVDEKYIILLIGIDKFHSFFSQEAGMIHFLNEENRNKKFYTNKELKPREIVVLTEIFNYNLNAGLEVLYTKGKVYELLSLFFNKDEETDIGNCPFLKDENNVKKILQAKKILINDVANPPTLNELSQMIELPLRKLKDGFKQIYGQTVFNFLLNFKMEMGRSMIESNEYNVSEISDKLGYSTPSHFISAFKKKYGTTPKQFMGKS